MQEQKAVWDRLPELTRESIIAMVHFTCPTKVRKYRKFAANTIIGMGSTTPTIAESIVNWIAYNITQLISQCRYEELRLRWHATYY